MHRVRGTQLLTVQHPTHPLSASVKQDPVGQKNEMLEDFFTNLQRLTIVHEKDAEGGDLYAFQTRLDIDED